MTDEKVAPSGLPEKEWFTLDEIAQRWGCSVEHVVHLGAAGHVELGVVADEWEVALAVEVHEEPDGYASSSLPALFNSDRTIKPGEIDEIGQPISTEVVWGFVGLHKEQLDRIKASGYAVADFARWGTVAQFNFNMFVLIYEGSRTQASKYPIVRQHSEGGSFHHGPAVEIDDLVMHILERDRFEKEHRVGAHAGEMPKIETAGRWPWGGHETELLRHLAAAAERFWVNYDPSDPSTAETNETVAEWLRTERKLAKQNSEAIARILRADGLPKGPRK